MGLIERVKRLLKEKEKEGADLVGLPQAYDQKQKFQFHFLKYIGLTPEQKFVDVGCGVLRGGLPIIKFLNPGCYTGLDVSNEALAIAQKEVIANNLSAKKTTLLHVDVSLEEIEIPYQADLIWAFSVLIHMTDEHIADCLRFVAKNLKANGVFYANVNLGNAEDGKWREFPVKWRNIEWFEAEANRVGLVVNDIGTLASFGHKSISDVREDLQHMLKFTLVK